MCLNSCYNIVNQPSYPQYWPTTRCNDWNWCRFSYYQYPEIGYHTIMQSASQSRDIVDASSAHYRFIAARHFLMERYYCASHQMNKYDDGTPAYCNCLRWCLSRKYHVIRLQYWTATELPLELLLPGFLLQCMTSVLSQFVAWSREHDCYQSQWFHWLAVTSDTHGSTNYTLLQPTAAHWPKSIHRTTTISSNSSQRHAVAGTLWLATQDVDSLDYYGIYRQSGSRKSHCGCLVVARIE